LRRSVLGKLLSKQKLRVKQRSSKKNLEFYLDKKYTIVVRPLSNDEGGGWFAEIPLLPGCWADGETPDDAIAELSAARALWTESMLNSGRVIPLP
jgi:antitoxin HicB